MKNKTRDFLFIIGLILILFNIFIVDGIYQKGLLYFPSVSNFATLIYALCYGFGLFLVGIIGLVMVIISARHFRD